MLFRSALIGLSLLVLIGAGFSAASQASNKQTLSDPHAGLTQITVGSGQTLWNIASTIDSNKAAELVSTISDVNGLTTVLLTPGEKIWVPSHA